MRLILVVSIIAVVAGRPSDDVVPNNVASVPPNCPTGQEWYDGACRDIWRLAEQQNVVTVPPNCLPGRQWYNGACRDIWRSADTQYVVTVPPNYRPGQQWYNGARSYIWRSADTQNVVTVPPNCPPSQQWWNGACRDIWRFLEDKDAELMDTVHKREVFKEKAPEIVQNPCKATENGQIICISVNNIIPVAHCPHGTQADSWGNCRPFLP